MPRESIIKVQSSGGLEPQVTVLVAGHEPLRLDLRAVSAENRAHAELHGWEQRLRDAAAIPFSAEEKRYATAEEKYLAIKALVDHYGSGASEWTIKSRGPSEGSLLYRALMAEKPRKPEVVKAYIAELKPSQRRALLDSERLVDIVRRLRSESTTQVDADALLAELDKE